MNDLGRAFDQHAQTDETMDKDNKGKKAFNRSQSRKSNMSSQTGKESIVDNYVRRQVLKAQIGKAFPSKEAKRLDIVFKEVDILSNQLAMTLVNTRQKL